MQGRNANGSLLGLSWSKKSHQTQRNGLLGEEMREWHHCQREQRPDFLLSGSLRNPPLLEVMGNSPCLGLWASQGPFLEKQGQKRGGLQAFCSTGWNSLECLLVAPAEDGWGVIHIPGMRKQSRILAREEVLVTESVGNLFSIWGTSWKMSWSTRANSLLWLSKTHGGICRGFQTRKVPDVWGIAFNGWFEIMTHFYLLHRTGKVCLSKWKVWLMTSWLATGKCVGWLTICGTYYSALVEKIQTTGSGSMA